MRRARPPRRLPTSSHVSHLGESGVAHVLELATRPLIATHSSARAQRDHHRNLTDVQARGIAATGGVVCADLLAGFVHTSELTLDPAVDHVEHLADVSGVDHVGLGPDFVDGVPSPCDRRLTARPAMTTHARTSQHMAWAET